MEKKNILINNIDEITMKGKNIKSDNINTNNSETNIIYKTKNITINNTSINKKSSNKFITFNKNINSDIKSEKKLNIKDNNLSRIFTEKCEQYYCLNCKKIINISKGEKINHKNCNLFPYKEIYSKSEVDNLIKHFENELNNKNNDLRKIMMNLIKKNKI